MGINGPNFGQNPPKTMEKKEVNAMNPRLKTVAALLAAVTALTSAALALGAEDSASPSPGESAPPEETPAQTREESPFVLREFEGRVAVYAPGRDIPLSVTAIEVGTLRERDRSLLRRGLAAESREELLMLLEDLGS